MKLNQTAKLIFTFVLAFFASYFAVKIINGQLSEKQRIHHQEEAVIIQEEIKERFNNFLEFSLLLGKVSAEYVSLRKDQNDFGYVQLVQNVFKEKPYILGINQLDSQGLIIHTFPVPGNTNAKGKVTQNLAQLRRSFTTGEPYWFSPPFKLFQGGYGFGFYVPIIKNKQLQGWIAPVISSQLFFEQFRELGFFNKYELIIKDAETSKNYFFTSTTPPEKLIQETVTKVRGRTIVLQSWSKKEDQLHLFSSIGYLLVCLGTAVLATLAMRLYLQKRKAFSRLESISVLLRLTAKEALSKLMDIHSEYLVLGSTGYIRTSVVEKDVDSMTDLIEQIDLLQTIAESDQVEEESFHILPILKEQTEEMSDLMIKKEILIDLNEDSLKDVKVIANRWLISNTVIKNAITHCVLHAHTSKTVLVNCRITNEGFCSLNFHFDEAVDQSVFDTFKMERRLLVARNAMEILGGKLLLQHDTSGGVDLRLEFKQA